MRPKYTDEKYSKRSQTTAIPEGTSYTYELIQQYTGINDSTSLLYKHSTFADTMPHEGDKETSNFDVTTKTYSLRQSQWSGWLQDLDSIKMEYTDTTPTEEGDIKGKYELRIASAKDPVTGQTLSPQASVWVGPIATAGTGANVKYTPLTTDDIYEPIDAAKAAEAAAGGEWAEDENDEYITRWVTEKTTGLTLGEDGKTVVSEVPVSQSMASINMVNINDLKDYVKRHPAEEEALTRCIGAIWCRVLDDSLVLMARNGDVRLKYDLKAPLNLPKYLGNAGKTYKSIDGLQEGATPLQEYLYKTSQWNTFMSMVDYRQGERGLTYRKMENKPAGVYVDAPEGFGYIGSYVWMDTNWDTLQNDTKGDVVTDLLGHETTYHKGENGRYILSTEKSIKNGKYAYTYEGGKDTAKLLNDLDYDGVPDDPGVNGVKVELLNEWGVPVNRNGEAVVQVKMDANSSKLTWVKADPKTGAAVKGLYGYEPVTTADNVDLGAYVYTTESDYYNNRGYYMFSMLKPGTYRLRFTFPQKYANYALTTKRIGASDAPVIEVDEKTGKVSYPGATEDISSYMAVTRTSKQMVAVSDPIEVEPVIFDAAAYAAGNEPDHELYDAKMTSYNVGIALPVVYEGVTYRDDKLAGYEEMEEDPEEGGTGEDGGDEGGEEGPGDIFAKSASASSAPAAQALEAAPPVSQGTPSLPGISTLSLTPDNAPTYDAAAGELPPFIMVNGKPTLNLNKYVELDGSVDPELIDGVLDWVNVNLDESNPYEYAVRVNEMRLKNMEVRVMVQNEKTKKWEQAFDTNGNMAVAQTDCYLEVSLDGGATYQRAFDTAGNNLVSAEVLRDVMTGDNPNGAWRWTPYEAGSANATGFFHFSLEPFHNYKVVCKDTRARILKPSVMTWENDPLARPTKNAEDQEQVTVGTGEAQEKRPKDEVAAMWDNDLWLKSGSGETNSFYAEIPTDEAGHAVYEDSKNAWKGYKIYDKLALGWIDGTKGFLGNYVWSDKSGYTEDGVIQHYDGLQGDVPNIGVGRVKVTLEQYYWLPSDASGPVEGSDGYNAGTANGTYGKGRWVLNDLEYKTTTSSSSGSYIFKGVSTYVVDPNAPKTVAEEDKTKYLAGYRVRIDRDDLKLVTRDFGLTFRNAYDPSSLSFDEEIDSDADMAVRLVLDGEGNPYYKNGKPVYAYYLNEAGSGDPLTGGMGAGTTSPTGAHDVDVSYQQMIVVAGNTDTMARENLVAYLVELGRVREDDADVTVAKSTVDALIAQLSNDELRAYLIDHKVIEESETVSVDRMKELAANYSGTTAGNDRAVQGGLSVSAPRAVYDLGAAQRIEHWDVGLVEVPRSSITGTVWHDEDYDGIKEDGEQGLAGESVALEQYYYDEAAGAWVRNDRFGDDVRTSVDASWHTETRKDFMGEDYTVWVRTYTDALNHKVSSEVTSEADTLPMARTAADGLIYVETDDDGVYTFENLPTAYTNDEGEHFLAAYRVVLNGMHQEVAKDDAGNVLYSTPWMMTNYHQGTDVAADSDVADDQSPVSAAYRIIGRETDGVGETKVRALDGQIILAAEVSADRVNAKQPSQVDVPLGDVHEGATGTVKYDYLTKRDHVVDGGDVGELPVPRREVSGRVWHDADYDGVQAMVETEEPVLDERGNPIPMLDAAGNPVLAEDGSSKMLTRKVRSYAADEPGIQDEAVTLSQWYWDGAEWVRNEAFGVDGFNVLEAIATDEWAAGAVLSVDDPTTVDVNEAGYVTVRTNADGLYRFQNLPTAYVNESGELFLASYRLTLDGLEQQEVEQGGTVVSRVPWLMTRYHAGAAVAVDSDIDDALDGTLDSYSLLGREGAFEAAVPAGVRAHEGQIILAAPKADGIVAVADKTTLVSLPIAEVVEATVGEGDTAPAEALYDIMRARKQADEAYDGGDAGQLPVPTRSLTGLVWRDADYDGLQNTEDFEDIEVVADDGTTSTVHKLVEEGLADQAITLEQWYYDPENVNPDDVPVFDGKNVTDLSGSIGNGVYESHWFQNTAFGADIYTTLDDADRPLVDAARYPTASAAGGVITVQTDEDGLYRFDNLPCAYTDADGKQYLAGYRVKLAALTEDYDFDHYGTPQEGAWMMTRFHAGAVPEALSTDSDLPDNLGLTAGYPLIGREAFVADVTPGAEGEDDLVEPKRYLGERQEMLEGQIILANHTELSRGAAAQKVVPASDYQNNLTGELLFDFMDARAYAEGADALEAGDAGELPPPTQDIVGIFWNDTNNDGVQSLEEGDDEYGINGRRVTLERYLPDGQGGWERDPQWADSTRYDLNGADWDAYDASPATVWGDDAQHVTYTATQVASDGEERDGVYRFEDLPTQRAATQQDVDAGRASSVGAKIVYGYRVRYTDAGYQQRAWMIAKYQQRDNFTQDSDLINVNANLMGADEVDVLLNRRDDSSVLGNLVDSSASNNDNQDLGLLSRDEALAQSKSNVAAQAASANPARPAVAFASVLATAAVTVSAAVGAAPLAAGIETYDLGAGSDRAYNDGALLKRKTGAIEGVLFQDDDYDGVADEGEAGLAGKRVYLRAWGLHLVADVDCSGRCATPAEAGEGQWPAATGRIVAAGSDGAPKAGYHYEWVAEEGEPLSVLTDEDGHYVFEDLPAATRNIKSGDSLNWKDEEGGDNETLVTDTFDEWYLLGYTIEVEGDSRENLGADRASETVVGLPVTRLLDDGGEEIASRNASKVHRAADSDDMNGRLANDAAYGSTRYAITMNQVNEQGAEVSVLDGRLVLAEEATTAEDAVGATDSAYYVNANGMAFDLSTVRSAAHMNGGFGPFGTATIKGVAWDDVNYDGIRNFTTSIDVPGDEDADEGEGPTTVVELEKPLVGETVYITQEYLDGGQWVLNRSFGGAIDPKVGDLVARRDSVFVKFAKSMPNTEYRIGIPRRDADGNVVRDENGRMVLESLFRDANGNPPIQRDANGDPVLDSENNPLPLSVWFTSEENVAADGETVFVWPDGVEPGTFANGAKVTIGGVAYTLTIDPNTEYYVTCRQLNDEGSYVECLTPRAITTPGEAIAEALFAEGPVTAAANTILFTEKADWWKSSTDPDVAEADLSAGEHWNGWEYAAVAPGEDPATLDSERWRPADETGMVQLAGLAQRTDYQLVARVRPYDELLVPDVAMRTVDDATAILEALGLAVAIERGTEFSSTVPAGAVVRTEPAAGSKARPGVEVKLVVSNGEARAVTVEDVTGQSVEEAEAALAAAGFAVEVSADERYSEDVAAGLVAATRPGAGSVAAQGTTVVIYRSKGPKPAEPAVPDPGETTEPGGDNGDGDNTGNGSVTGNGGTEGDIETVPEIVPAAARLMGTAALYRTLAANPMPLAVVGEGFVYDGALDGLDAFHIVTLPDVMGTSVGYLPAGLADTEGNRQKNEKPSPAGSRAAETDSEGVYTFDDLQVYVQKDASGRLVDYNTPGALDEVYQTRYTVHMAELNGGYVMSRYNVPGGVSSIDSDLTRSESGLLTLRQAVTYQNGMTINDGKVYLNHESSNVRGSVFGSQYDEDAQWKKTEEGDTWADGANAPDEAVAIFDVPAPIGKQLDAGAKAPNKNVIAGTVWNDANDNGYFETGEAGIVGATVELSRYWYDGDSDTWVYDDAFNRAVAADGSVVRTGEALTYALDEGVAIETRSNEIVTTTEFSRMARNDNGEEVRRTYPQGYWEFADLPATEERDDLGNTNREVVYGYRVNVVEVPAGYAVAKMNRGEDDEIDSDLNEATTRLTPEGERAVDGLIVLAEPAEEADAPESKVAGPDADLWSTLGSQSSYYNDAGLVPFNTVSVGGHVWLDANKDGLQAETDELVAGKEVVLERQQTTFAAARAVGWMSRVTDGAVGSDLAADGEPLVAAERYDDIQWVLDDLAGKVPDEPVVEPSEGEQPGLGEQPGTGGETGEGVDSELPGDGGATPDADESGTAGTFRAMAALPMLDVADGAEDGDDNTGSTPAEGTDETEGGDDVTDSDGTDEETPVDEAAVRWEALFAYDVADPSADLERLEDDGILSEGTWETVATATTDMEGNYLFAGQPIVDEYGKPYVYRVRFVKPSEAEWIPLNAGTDDNLDNDVAHLNLRGREVEPDIGVTEVLGVLSPRGAANAYGQAYRVLAPQQWTHEAAHAVDPGYYVEPEPLEDTDGWLTRVFYKVKKLAQTGDTATLLCLILAIAIWLAATILMLSLLSRRKEEEDEDRWIDITV